MFLAVCGIDLVRGLVRLVNRDLECEEKEAENSKAGVLHTGRPGLRGRGEK